MKGKSTAIVGFIANLLPLYNGERPGDVWCARNLQDGSVILPVAEDDEDEGWVRIHWQGDPQRQTEVLGEWIATLALERYVRLHGVGASEEAIAAELWFMARHFEFKTGCHVYLPQLREPAHPAARAAKRMGEGVLVNLISKLAGA
jgi:hypothetical protein